MEWRRVAVYLYISTRCQRHYLWDYLQHYLREMQFSGFVPQCTLAGGSCCAPLPPLFVCLPHQVGWGTTSSSSSRSSSSSSSRCRSSSRRISSLFDCHQVCKRLSLHIIASSQLFEQVLCVVVVDTSPSFAFRCLRDLKSTRSLAQGPLISGLQISEFTNRFGAKVK